jgi:hypothetical protein
MFMLNKGISSFLSLVLSGLLSPVFANPIQCKDYDGKKLLVKPKTITIYNNSNTTIYPIISTSKNAVNEWVQACFRTTAPYPTKYVYKLYVNEEAGIAPGKAVTITLPLFSKLTTSKYITWWNGGRVVLADKNENLRNLQDKSIPVPAGVTCAGSGMTCQLKVYSSNVQFPENIYAQLSEFTFGDSIIPPGQTLRLLKPENVGYNISYVDHVYMPIAIGPKNNPYIGYSGSTKTLIEFRTHLLNFLQTEIGNGWPVYNLGELKLPGGYNIFAQRTGTLPPDANAPVKPEKGFPPVLTVLDCLNGKCNEKQKSSLHFGQSVQSMQNLWGSCVHWNEDISKYVTEKIDCPEELQVRLGALQRFFAENHKNYVTMFNAGQCAKGSQPVPFSYWQALNHIYGWVPFNEGCGAAANPLVNTKIDGWDHARMQSMYIHELEYNYKNANLPSALLFNPYVKLIHAPDYLSMDAYGFSVDDAVGFMSELGDGLIFTVGGSRGLTNKQPFNYADGFSVSIGVPLPVATKINTPLIKQYGVCVFNQSGDPKCANVKQNVIMPTNSQIAGFRVGNVASYPIRVNFTDVQSNVYSFMVNEKFAPCPDDVDPSTCPVNKVEIINKKNCIVKTKTNKKHPKSDEWCQNVNPNQSKEKQVTKNYISFPQPVDFMK